MGAEPAAGETDGGAAGLLRIQARRTAAELVVEVAGELDIATTPSLRTLLDEAVDGGARRVVLDLAALDFLDSTGLATLIHASKRLRGSGGDLVLRAPSRSVRSLLRIVGLDTVLSVED
ncbi:MAG TPA: STAS domain-containing protein [Acidimicrobiales bacterium]|jgi:anti-sigma B factor antagonist|nr:STAS domain-containing protein [Acidimicrobiales bacterium]